MTEKKDNVVSIEQGTVYESMDEIFGDGATEVEYAMMDGFKPGKKLRIGSVTAGDIMDWTEASDGEAKKTAGLRLIQKSLVNSKGERIASDPAVLQKLKGLRHKETDRMVKEILKLNGMSVKGDNEEKKD